MRDVTWIAGPERLLVCLPDQLNQVTHHSSIVVHFVLQADTPENLVELVGGDESHLDLSLDATQKCIIHRFGRIKISGKSDNNVKWNLDLLPPCKGEEVDPAIQGTTQQLSTLQD